MSNYFVRIVWCLLLFTIADVFTTAGIADMTGTIEQKDEKTVCLNIKVTKPAPSTAIITMDLPEGITITKSEPNYSRFSQEKRQVQWLLKDIKPGATKIVVQFDKQIDPTKLQSVVRYKDAAGNTIESKISK